MMARSVIISFVILAVIIALSVFSVFYTKTASEFMADELSLAVESIEKGAGSETLDNTIMKWEEERKILMFILNHRDIDDISLSLLKAKQKLSAGKDQEAVDEIKVAIFLVKGLHEKEKIKTENIL